MKRPFTTPRVDDILRLPARTIMDTHADPRDVTRCLRRFSAGDHQAFDQVMGMVYQDLRLIAHRQLRKARFGSTLDTTGLVHEAYLKLVDQTQASWQDRKHFFAITARAMRQIIVDYARRRYAQKRGGGQAAEELHEESVADQAAAQREAEHILALNDAMESLGRIDERMLRVVECRFFGGLSEQETAEALDMSLRTAQRTWKRARAWMKEELAE